MLVSLSKPLCPHLPRGQRAPAAPFAGAGRRRQTPFPRDVSALGVLGALLGYLEWIREGRINQNQPRQVSTFKNHLKSVPDMKINFYRCYPILKMLICLDSVNLTIRQYVNLRIWDLGNWWYDNLTIWQCEACSLKFEVRGLRWDVWGLEVEVWSLQLEVWSLQFEVGSLNFELWMLKFEVWRFRCEDWNLEFGN